MNAFEIEATGVNGVGLHSIGVETLQVKLGLKCNQGCNHCHLEASPERKEVMQ